MHVWQAAVMVKCPAPLHCAATIWQPQTVVFLIYNLDIFFSLISLVGSGGSGAVDRAVLLGSSSSGGICLLMGRESLSLASMMAFCNSGM